MLRDLTHAVAMLRQSKGWTAVVLLSLALGIGANATLFTAINGVLLQTVPVPDPDALVRLKWYGDNQMVRNTNEYGFSQPYEGQQITATFSYPAFLALRSANQTLTDLFGCAPTGSANVVIDNQAEISPVFLASGNYFSVLRVRPLAGRLLTEDDDRPSAPPVAVISEAFWRRRFGASPSAVGRVVPMNSVQVTIVGITPAAFTGVQRLSATAPDITVPLSMDPQINAQSNLTHQRLGDATAYWVQLLGRRKPGVSLEAIKGNLNGVFQQSARDGMTSYLAGLDDAARGLTANKRDLSKIPELAVLDGAHGVYDFDNNSATTARYLAGVVIVLLLIVCANVANLLLSRASARRKEIAVRLSMGASRARLVRQLLTESVLLATLGGALGLLVGYWSRSLLPFGATAPMNWRVFVFVFGVSLVTGIVFGLLPAMRATRVDLAGVMKTDSRSVAAGRGWLGKGLLVVQVALSLVLVIGAGLFLRTLHNLRTVDVGFNTNNVLMFSVNAALNGYDVDRARVLFTDMKQALGALPGVRAVALTRTALLAGSRSTSTTHVAGKPGTNIHMMTVSPEFFATMEIPIVAGRGFTDRDTPTSPKVVVINEAAARRLFPGENAPGRRLGFSPETHADFEVVGVIGDTKYASVRDEAPPTIYQAVSQGALRSVAFVLRTAADPALMTEPVRAAIQRIDSNLPLTGVSTQAERVEQRFAQERLFANASSLFGGLGLLLAAIGLFGLMSYNVSRRSQELGIRMALGAKRADVILMVLAESLLLVAIGVAIGLTTAYLLGQLIATQLFGLSPMDVPTIVLAVAVIAAVTTLAGYLPARRASRVDPMVVLNRG